MRYWWVNQNQTYRAEVRGNFMWSPRANANGARNQFHGSNGLLLSPHVDHLFDQGYISSSNSEELLVVPAVRDNLLDKWGIDAGTRVGEFNREQQAFLDYHRANVFKGLRTP